MKKSLVTTFLNEELSVEGFLHSINQQKNLPDEIILIDGGSTDTTYREIEKLISKSKNKRLYKLFIKKGNRSVGRNEAISKASGDIILITDAGCILDKNWVREITKPFSDNDIDVVAGYYDARTSTIFEKCLIPYVLVMPDRVNPKTFLPATRSMAIRKNIWKELGGFDEQLSHNEDYDFSNKLKKEGKRIFFAQNAIVYWIPRRNLSEAFTMFKRFAYGDIEAGIFRPKVILIFVRYFIMATLIVTATTSQNLLLWLLNVLVILLYITWAVKKNYKYVKELRAFYFLPLIQVSSDIAIILGSTAGLLTLMRKNDYNK